MKLDQNLVTAIKANLATDRIVPALMGDPAIGKSSIVESLGKEIDAKVFTIQVNQLSEKADFTGVRTVNDNGVWKQIFFPHSTLVEANEYALANPDKLAVVNLDEINRTDPEVATAAMSLPTSRTCGNLAFAPNVRFIVTGNVEGDIVPLDSAKISRFALYNVEPDADTFLKIMGDKLNSFVRDVLIDRPDLIFQKPESKLKTFRALQGGNEDEDMDFHASFGQEPMLQFTAPRTLEGVSDFINAADEDFLRTLESQEDPKENITLLRATLEGHTGDTEFTHQLHTKIVAHLNANRHRQSGPASTTMAAPARPNVYANLENATTTDEIERLVGAIDEDGLTQVFLYTMCQSPSRQHTVILRAVAQNMKATNTDLNKDFVRYLTHGMVHQQNIDQLELEAGGSPIYAKINPIVDMFG